jgi:hypothetical protein
MRASPDALDFTIVAAPESYDNPFDFVRLKQTLAPYKRFTLPMRDCLLEHRPRSGRGEIILRSPGAPSQPLAHDMPKLGRQG